eukprot:scaffold287_cov151-Skeletonema_marinoi.AAC.1
MWDRFSFDVDDDGLWLLHALLNGSLVIVHDGSFMPQLTSHACSCAFVLYCSSTDKRAIGSFAEESANADNYIGIGEWLGSIGAFHFEPSVEEASWLELSNYISDGVVYLSLTNITPRLGNCGGDGAGKQAAPHMDYICNLPPTHCRNRVYPACDRLDNSDGVFGMMMRRPWRGRLRE